MINMNLLSVVFSLQCILGMSYSAETKYDHLAKSSFNSHLSSNKFNHFESLTAFSNLSDIIHGFHWKTVAILQTAKEEAGSIVDILQPNPHGISVLVYTINPFNAGETLAQIHDLLFPDINVIVDIDTKYLTDFILQVDRFDEESNHTTDFWHHSKWLIVCSGLALTDAEEKFVHLENIAVTLTGNGNSTSVSSETHLTLRQHRNGSVLTPVSECGPHHLSPCYFPNVMYGYNNRRLLVMLLPSDMHVIKEVANGKVHYKGYALDILDVIAKTLNFSYDIKEPSDGSWGLLENGTWNGIVGHLDRKEIDLAACDLTVHEGRAKVVDFIYPPIKTDGTLALYKRHKQSYFYLLLRPLQSEVYVTMFVVTVLVMIIFKCAEGNGADRKKIRRKNICRWLCKTFLTDNRNHIGKALFRQGTSQSPETASGRVLLSSWWVFVMIMTSVYCANLVASFSTQRDIRPFSSLEELLDSDYGVGMRVLGITQVIIKNSKQPIMKRLWKKITQQGSALHMLTSDQVNRVKSEKFAFITYRLDAEMYMADDCDLDLLPQYFSWELLAFAVPKQSPLKRDIERVMSNLEESGILDMIGRKWFKSRNSTMCVSERKVNPITLKTLGGGGIVVGAGVLLASIVLVLERLKRKCM